ncbi:Crp/Fnr family transcriptional regulator [Dinghuibacter silviterrae]|uniref:CRP-like cAMP-binding protein n=1 Tax=Dinghuibacter silviterrae TaxID=1539049 RepID=A0A4R8DGN7_9BACT|nr:Crp/Fnr family transcriptional regulator [Dinghuibacter silviterrae]TDW96839.1 CRP-like cAMP-binding protein [Dinghuibacter silviterrae]
MSIKGIFPIDNWDFKSQSILSGLPEEDLDMLMERSTTHTYKKGDTIFREGSFPSSIFFIATGKVKKFKTDKAGREQIIYVANTGELIGYHAVLSEGRYPDSAATLEESTLTVVEREDFLHTLRHSPTLNHRLLQNLSHEFSVLINNLTLFARRSVRERLALQLVVLREKYKINFEPGTPVEINLSREDLASLAGTTRENVVRILTEFKEEGLLQTKGRKIVVLDVRGLIGVAES